MQWYGFHKEPAGGSDPEGTRKSRLLEIFGGWSDNVVDLIKATPEEDILRRDIFDRPPVFKWSEGRTVLLGDAVHAMQPNLGQGEKWGATMTSCILLYLTSSVHLKNDLMLILTQYSQVAAWPLRTRTSLPTTLRMP